MIYKRRSLLAKKRKEKFDKSSDVLYNDSINIYTGRYFLIYTYSLQFRFYTKV